MRKTLAFTKIVSPFTRIISLVETTRLLTEEGMMARNGKPFVKMQVARIISQVRNAA